MRSFGLESMSISRGGWQPSTIVRMRRLNSWDSNFSRTNKGREDARLLGVALSIGKAQKLIVGFRKAPSKCSALR